MVRREMPETWFGKHPTTGHREWGNVHHPDLDELPVQRDRIYNTDWDTLFILDACRFDMLYVMLNGKRLVKSIEPVYSKALRTREWLDWVWTGEETESPSKTIPEITYYSGSPWTDTTIYDDSRTLHSNVDVKQMYKNSYGDCWKQNIGVIDPKCVINTVMNDNERKLVHLMQPHQPYIGQISLKAMRAEDGYPELSPLHELVYNNLIDYKFVRAAYYYNLLEAVRAIGFYVMNNQSERIVISADHGDEITENRVSHTNEQPVPWAKLGRAWE